MKVQIPIFVILNNFKNFKALHAYGPTTVTTSNRADPTAEKTFCFSCLICPENSLWSDITSRPEGPQLSNTSYANCKGFFVGTLWAHIPGDVFQYIMNCANVSQLGTFNEERGILKFLGY
jgi:hypothetical protein